MWLFNKPPVEVLKQKYGFEPTAAWLEHVQKSCVRFSTGGSGSLVSADGLVMTNHHVGSDVLQQFSTKEHDCSRRLLRRERTKSCACTRSLLWSIETHGAVMGAAKEGRARPRRGRARRSRSRRSRRVDGPQERDVTSAGRPFYLYRTDLHRHRLVMAPEKDSAFYGGDPDNFEFPRYCLDMCFFRIYEDGKPVTFEHFLSWSPKGSAENDLVFVAGHPGTTERLKTVDDMRWMRDYVNPMALARLWRREVQMQTFSGRSAENARLMETDLFSVQNSRKARTGILQGLLDPELFAGKISAEKTLRGAVAANPEWQAKWGGAWDRISATKAVARTIYPRFIALGGSGMNLAPNLRHRHDLIAARPRKPRRTASAAEYGESARKTLEWLVLALADRSGMEIDAWPAR
jgi:hypothetical protein